MFKREDVQIILWLTFITVVAWIAFHIYHVSVASTISEEIQAQIAPIDPDFDMNTINKLKNRKYIEPLYQFIEQDSKNNATAPAQFNIQLKENISPLNTQMP